jgi:hypothetical protein
MKLRLHIIILTILLFPFLKVNAQEYVTGITVNEKVATKLKVIQSHYKNGCGCNKTKAASLTLPFFDDFSKINTFPDKQKWEDKDVYINNSYSFRVINPGVATLDALDSTGNVYKDASWIGFVADHLTSRPIRTDSVFTPEIKKLTVKDSLFLSFFYQPQGRADKPEASDSLVLQFAHLTGDTVLAYMDSVEVNTNYYLDLYDTDTIFPGDTLWAPPGCNPNVFTISYTFLYHDTWIKVPCDSIMEPEIEWKTVWSDQGSTLLEFQKKHKTNFVQVLVPLNDTIYFYNSFKFRFLNYASISSDIIPSWRSNCDIWNIDYVYLNYGRSSKDTSYQGIYFADRAPSFLEDYRIMPYRQYRADPYNSIAKEFKMYFINLDSIVHNTNYKYKVKMVNGNDSYEYFVENFNLYPPDITAFADTLPWWQLDTLPCTSLHSCPPVGKYFALDYNVDTMSYWITHYITGGNANENELKDSIKFNQGFYNYFAYDDGIPELGYGIEPAGAECAYKFKTNVRDSIRGVQIYFNKTLNNSNEIYFDLKVWRDNNGQPGQVVYNKQNVKVSWNNLGNYSFYYYKFDEPFEVQGVFYVGWKQSQTGSINIGFDANNDHHDKIFYTYNNQWVTSNYHGSLLMRPVVGPPGFVGINEHASEKNRSLKLYPNPAKGHFMFDNKYISNNKNDNILIYNILGSTVKQRDLTNNTITTEDLPSGIYIVKIKRGTISYTGKLLISH